MFLTQGSSFCHRVKADGAVHNRPWQVRHVSAHNRSPSPIVSDICIASPVRLVAVATEGADEYVSWDLINHGIWVVVETDNLAITSSRYGTCSNESRLIRREIPGSEKAERRALQHISRTRT
ncbi:hypothetical protein PG985_009389 [Apiospora marii]|uniref:uncharacterized protein n=1 Tax=Apiospora marii TaxID=335849 RepID=UPI003131492F